MMADERPKPRYGEYATPQEQAEIVARSMPPLSPLLTPADQPAAVPPAGGVAAGEGAGAMPGGSAASSAAPAKPRIAPPKPRMWDRVLSLALLGYGLYTVLTGLFQYADLAGVIQQVYEIQGIGTYTATASAETAGVVIRVVLVGVWLVTALLTVRLLRAGRFAFYVPVIGGVLVGIVISVMLGGLLVADPAFMDYVGELQS
ncbi:MAG: hypothetical protein RI885_868 [Actinomycetota bacterium]